MGVRGSIAVVGGGISGLATAYRLKKSGNKVTLFEASSCVGGKIGTMYRDGYELDLGPVTIAETPELRQLIDELDLEVVEASEAAAMRYIFSRGRLHLVKNPLTGSLLSLGGKLSMLRAPFTSKAKPGETVADYARKRVGEEAYQRLFNPMMNGIFAGNSELLSAVSVIRKRTPRKIISLRGGISALTKALAERLGDSVKVNTPFTDISGFDQVYLTIPAFDAAKIVKELSEPLNKIHYSSLTQIYCEVIPGERKFEGFGFLVPSEERMSLLGAVCVSNLFPSKAHDGKMLFVLFCGGDRPYDFTHNNDVAVNEFNKIIQPAISKVLHVQEWKRAIPQFYVGHEAIIAQLKSYGPTIVFGGSYVTGVAVGDCV